jgi:NADH-quinone oxidoreductase subunit J
MTQTFVAAVDHIQTQTILAAVDHIHMGNTEKVLFWIFGPLALLGAIGMVWARNAVHSALFLVCTMMSLGVFYVLEAGPFIGMVQIIVYTGAIMMLFLFVLMLVGRDSSDALIETLRGQRTAAILLGIGFAGLVCTVLARALDKTITTGLDTANAQGNVQGIARLLFTKYVFAFEVTSALLITAAVGAMLLAHVEQRKEDKVTQVDRMKARFLPGNYPGPRPGPGVYATSDSVATPAMLPDGTAAERSISKILPPRELTPAEAAPKRTLTGPDPEDAETGGPR